MRKLIDYLKYSGLSVTISLNPLHWHYVPRIFTSDKDAWDIKSRSLSFLFLTIRVWMDDGSW